MSIRRAFVPRLFRVIAAQQRLVDHRADDRAHDRREPEQPQLLQRNRRAEQRRAGAACGVDRGIGEWN